MAVAGTSQFAIGTEASCSDGAVGKVSRVIAGPVAGEVTCLVVEPGHQRGPGRLVPLDLVEGAAGGIRLRCTRAEFEKLDPAGEARLVPAASASPGTVRDWRRQLTLGEDRIDTATWAGSVPQSAGVAPRVRAGRGKWFNLLWLLPVGLVLLLVAVAVAKGLRGTR